MTDAENKILIGLQRSIETLEAQMSDMMDMMHGSRNGEFGYFQKINIMWKSFVVWPLCVLSALLGAVGSIFLQYLLRP